MNHPAQRDIERELFEKEMLRLQYFEAHELVQDQYSYTDELAMSAWLAWEARAAQFGTNVVAWASSAPHRKNQLLSAAQFKNCLQKTRVEFDVPLCDARAAQATAELAALTDEQCLEFRRLPGNFNAMLRATYAAGAAAQRAAPDRAPTDSAEQALQALAEQAQELGIGYGPSRARKVGGSYQAEGYIVATFTTRAGATRHVFEFDSPAGMLHIFGPDQVEIEGEKS